MKLSIHPDPASANAAAAELLTNWLSSPATHNVMVAGGNSPLDLYRRIAKRRAASDSLVGQASSLPPRASRPATGLSLSGLNIFMLDEYVGVPLDEPRNCANLLRREVADAWGIPSAQFFRISSLSEKAQASVHQHERLIAQAGGLDIAILGLGQNGHIGFNEPGSSRESQGGLVSLEPISIEANRQWFGGNYAPTMGVTTGLKTILAARKLLVLAYGPHKATPVQAMVEGPQTAQCPASFLQGYSDAWLFLDGPAATRLQQKVKQDDTTGIKSA